MYLHYPVMVIFTVLLLLGQSARVAAAIPGAVDDTNLFRLGVIEVTGSRDRLPPGMETIDSETMALLNISTVGQALATQRGVSLTRNARNEDIVAVRGFDARQVPVFLDGIPLYVPYDGYVDFGRFTTFDLAEIRVSKGAASLLYGPNTLGGAVNLVSRRPVESLEGDLRLGSASGQRRQAALNLGSNQGSWYLQGGLSILEQDSFPLGDGFLDRKAVPTDTGDYRANAWSRDWKASLKVGYTPNSSDEYALGFTRQHGEKGNPVYTGTSTQGIRFWQWPFWDKDSLYFLSSTDLGADNTIKTRVYQDTYRNRIDAFTDATYTVPGQRRFFPSIYDDRNVGASIEWINRQFTGHQLQLAVHYKEDRHDEIGPAPPVARFRDVTQTLAFEDLITLSDGTRLRLGLSHERRDAREVFFWPTGEADAVNALVEVTRRVSGDLDVFASVSRRTRFPTIKDRYSARLGQALPNPELQPETALHGETGLRVQAWRGATANATLFYSGIDDLIQTTIVASSACGENVCNQAQNLGRARHRGIELSLEQTLGPLAFDVAYSYLDMDNLDNAAIPLTGAPGHRVFAFGSWQPTAALQVMLTAEAESGRVVPFAGSGQSQFRKLAGFSTWGLKAIWRPTATARVESGIDNLSDRHYELADGIPMPGRLWYVNLHVDI